MESMENLPWLLACETLSAHVEGMVGGRLETGHQYYLIGLIGHMQLVSMMAVPQFRIIEPMVLTRMEGYMGVQGHNIRCPASASELDMPVWKQQISSKTCSQRPTLHMEARPTIRLG